METPNKRYTISTEESERIRILKIWFTVMVIFIHSYAEEVHFSGENVVLQVPLWLASVEYIISQIISRCAVPGYFFISAVLLYKKEFTWVENIKKKLKSLLIPYLIFNTVWILIFFVAQHFAVFSPFFSRGYKIISNWGIAEFANAYLGFLDDQYPFPICQQLWFLRDLMVLNILAIVIKRLIDRFPKVVLAVLLLMIILNVHTHLFFLNESALIYFCLGYYFVKYSIKFNDVEKIKGSYIIIAYIFAIVLDFLTKDAAIHYLFHSITIFIGLIFFYRFTTKIPEGNMHKGLMYVAKYSFSIYLFHECNETVLRKALTKLLPQTALCQTVLYFGIPVVIFCLCLLLSVVLDKYFHRIYLVLVGNRSR